MPGYLLAQGDTILCMHAGQAQPSVPYPRVKVSGNPIVQQTTLYTISACPYLTGTVATPCVTATWSTGATRVKAGGQPVLLQDSQAVCAPNGTGVNIVMTQMRVKGT